MLKWLDRMVRKSIHEEMARETAQLAYEAQAGFTVATEQERVGPLNLKADRLTTVGLWGCRFPELVTYGPVDRITEQEIREIVHCYLTHPLFPQDGDQVVISGRRLTMRRLEGVKVVAGIFLPCLMVMEVFPELFTQMVHTEAYQIVGSVEPPIAHFAGSPAKTRTITPQMDYDEDYLMGFLRAVRGDSPGLSPTANEVVG